MKRLYTLISLVVTMAIATQAQVLTPQQALSRAKGTCEMRKAKGMNEGYQLVRTIKAEGENAIYMFQPTQGQGYMIVSAEEGAWALLAYSDKGNMDMDNLPEGMEGMLDKYAAQIAAYRATPIAVSRAAAQRNEIAPMIASQWGMGTPFNLFLPEGISPEAQVPSLAVATAQIMKHYEWPNVGTGSYECDQLNNKATNYQTVKLSMDFSTYIIEWEKMLDVYTSGAYDEEQAEAASNLMTAVSIALNTRYQVGNNTASTAYSNRVAYSLVNYFGYDKSAHQVSRTYLNANEWEEMVYEQLAKGQPVIYGGNSGTSSSAKTHAMICDGYKDGLYHFNFGWEGLGDGYFRLDAITPDDGEREWHYDGYNYSQYMIYNISPDKEGTSTDYTQMFLASQFGVQQNAAMEGCVSVQGTFYNNSLKPADAMIGLCVTTNENSDDDAIFLPGESLEGDRAGITVSEYNVSVDQLGNGRYLLRPACNIADGGWQLMRLNSQVDPYVIMIVNDGSYTFEALPTVNPIAKVERCNNAIYSGGPNNAITVSVYNPAGKKGFNGFIAGYFLDDAGNVIAIPNAAVRVTVDAGQRIETVYNVSFDFYTENGGDDGEGTGNGAGGGTAQMYNYRMAVVTASAYGVIESRGEWISEPVKLWLGMETDESQPEGYYVGIGSVRSNSDMHWYDMSGRQTTAPQRGLYINSRGEKVVLK